MRNHRKLLVIDGYTCFIGGINISADNDKTIRKNRYIHDLHAMITGPSVGEFSYSFIKDWCYSTRSNPDSLLQDQSYFPLPITKGEAIVRSIASGPGQDFEASSKVYLAATHIATKSLWIITPYFVPDKSFIKSLCMASAKGVDVRVIIPQNNNHWYVRFATSSLYHSLLETGIHIYEKKGVFSHAKAMLVDGAWATMGSSNCDNRSFRLNYELDFVVEDTEFITALKNQFQREMKHSVEIQTHRKKSLPRELIENICSLFAPVM
jgi:cardiolipin synthase